MIRFKLTIYQHGFLCKVQFHNDRAIVISYCTTMNVYESRYNPKFKKVTRTFKQSYTVFISRSVTYGLHINNYPTFLEHLTRNRVSDTEIEITIITPTEGEPINNIELAPTVKLLEHQPPIVEFICSQGNTKVLPLQTGKGKDQPLDALIKIPNGWKHMGDIKIGDKVIARDGTESEVIGVFPQGLQDVYRVTFHDGRSTECGGGHLWLVYSVGRPVTGKVVTTLDLIKLLDNTVTTAYNINLITPEDSDDLDINADPYRLGILLSKTYSGKSSKAVAALADRDMSLVIPEELLYHGSKYQRLAVLQGLFDTNGIVTLDNKIYFSTCNKQLVDDIQYLIWSLGGIATSGIKCNFGFMTVKPGPIIYELFATLKYPSNLFKDPENKRKIIDSKQTANLMKLKISLIEPIGKKETQCIAIDHPEHLYVTNDFIATHNTACSLYSIAKLKIRTAVIMGSMHVETWLKDARWMYTPESQDELIVIRGKGSLSKLIRSAQNNDILPSIIIITVTTLRDYLTEFEQTNKSTYGCVPGMLYTTLGVGFRITDEAHQNLHFGFRNDILTNVHKALYLSATIESNDAFTNKLYDLIFPRTKRYTGLAWKKYVMVQAVGYRLNKPDLVHCTGGSGYYSHIAYEQWLQKDKGRLLSYLEMIYKILVKGFLDKYQVGQKCVIFMSTIELCRTTAEYLQARIPQLTCADYTGEHEDIVLHTNDIVVSTPGSTGTGKDIKGLVMALNTVAISKREANIQILGRLREIETLFPGVEPVFYYLVCIDIAKHLQYHNSRVDLFRQFAKNVNIVNSSFII